ncbi:MAG TPA: hemerythrin domain-containing protein, partial [Verrucomicrobiae bacterium]|nr:hemerythrin domain-containing protein [Verrucomicrobiae bacterium]
DALSEHTEARELISKLERMDCQAPQWLETFKQLQQGILHHVQEEETQIFPKCTQFLDEKQCNEIAQKCRQMKETAQQTQRSAGKQPEKRV